MQVQIDDTQKQQIATAITTAERNTSAELVAVLAQSSDDYLYIPILWAALVALALPGIISLAQINMNFIHLYQAQIATFCALVILFRWPALKFKLIPSSVKQARATLRARDEFLTLGLHHTENRGAIMIFVSAAEHHVEILADIGITAKVSDETWQRIVNDFIAHIQQQQFALGYLQAIESCGALLAEHFPPDNHPENELTNQLIEV